jgi:hypothetical protein
MSTTTNTPEITPIPVQCSAHEFNACLSSRTSRCPSGVRSVQSAISASGTSGYGCSLRDGLRMSTEPWPHGPMMGRSRRPSWRVEVISRMRSHAMSAGCLATGPLPWRQKGRWPRGVWLSTFAGRADARHARYPWLSPFPMPHGVRADLRPSAASCRCAMREVDRPNGRSSTHRGLSASRLRMCCHAQSPVYVQGRHDPQHSRASSSSNAHAAGQNAVVQRSDPGLENPRRSALCVGGAIHARAASF